jgi:3D (Asp-Asp-Asp) domain-containing protein
MPDVCPAATWTEKTMVVTAYCPCDKCCGKYGWGYTTASGYKIQKGDRFVAAPKAYAFGTVMQIKGYGIVRVEDRGGAIKGNKLDVYFDTHQEALEWGVKKMKVLVKNG